MNIIDTQKEELIWKQARRRVKFKRSFATYIIVNAFFWGLWAFGEHEYISDASFPWPVWPMLGWGIGIAMQYYNAYMSDEPGDVEREYDRIRRR